MSRLVRPYIPLAVRVQVAERQLGTIGGTLVLHGLGGERVTARHRLNVLLGLLFNGEPSQLDHDPALVNRKFNKRTKKYTPDANDPRYLIYRTKSNHDTKTRVRGDHGQHSDLALVRKHKRRERKAARPKRKWAPGRKLQSRGFQQRGKHYDQADRTTRARNLFRS